MTRAKGLCDQNKYRDTDHERCDGRVATYFRCCCCIQLPVASRFDRVFRRMLRPRGAVVRGNHAWRTRCRLQKPGHSETEESEGVAFNNKVYTEACRDRSPNPN